MASVSSRPPDKNALERVGKLVRNRLEADPKAYKIPTDKAEIYAIGEFLTSNECRKLAGMIDMVARPSTLYEGTYKDGKLVTIVVWKPNGKKCPVTNVVNGNGVWVYYNYDGTERYRHTYKDGELDKD